MRARHRRRHHRPRRHVVAAMTWRIRLVTILAAALTMTGTSLLRGRP
jgi:hypothetical protein